MSFSVSALLCTERLTSRSLTALVKHSKFLTVCSTVTAWRTTRWPSGTSLATAGSTSSKTLHPPTPPLSLPSLICHFTCGVYGRASGVASAPRTTRTQAESIQDFEIQNLAHFFGENLARSAWHRNQALRARSATECLGSVCQVFCASPEVRCVMRVVS